MIKEPSSRKAPSEAYHRKGRGGKAVVGKKTGIQNDKKNPRKDRNVFAAIDLGTNNCRLLVVRQGHNAYRVVDRFSRIVRLGESLGQGGRLSDEAIRRTLSALRVCVVKIRRLGVTRLRCVATEACRRAANGAEFIAEIKKQTGLDFEVIDSREEARLAMLGCAPLLKPEITESLIFDIGGGSTEVSWIRQQIPAPEKSPASMTNFESEKSSEKPQADDCYPPQKNQKGAVGGRNAPARKRASPASSSALIMEDWHSVPVGVVALDEKFGGGRISPAQYKAMVEEVYKVCLPFEEKHCFAEKIARGRLQLLGASGTATTLVGLHKKLPRYDRGKVDGSYLQRDVALGLCQKVSTMPFQERIASPCIGRQRADLVVAGCAILEALLRLWPVEELRVADRGLREGILHCLMNQSP